MATIIEFKSIDKYFGSKAALKNISFQVAKGSIHGIIGENGAGKSTAMKILYGMYPATSGELFVNGQKVQFQSPQDAIAAGVGMVHQHFMLAEKISALDNILLHQKNSKFTSLLSRKQNIQQLQQLCKSYGFEIDLNKTIEDLSVGEQQRVEILKVLSQNSEILILDEPTAVLTPQEVQDLFRNLSTLKAQGKTILIISHKLKEILQITDSISVFRDGTLTASLSTAEATLDSLAEAMVGRKMTSPSQRVSQVDESKEILSLDGDFKLKIRKKEIVGIAGCEGNGQTDLIQKVLALRPQGQNLWGIFPEDRLRFGALPSRPLFENFILGHQENYLRKDKIFFDSQKVISKTQTALQEYDVRPNNENLLFSQLSGGNQQKLVVARELLNKPQFVLAAQPTRGVDIGAIEFIHNKIIERRDEGAGILLISSELDELMKLSDKILVLYKGRIIAEFERHQFNENKIGLAMGGVL